MSKVAVVDIGTNSTRLLITQSDREEGDSDEVRRAVVTGLGRGTATTGELSDAGMADTVEVLEEYRSEIEAHGVERVRAVATAAARIASNSSIFLDGAQAALGVRPEIIDGSTEASLSYHGAISDVPDDDWTVVDIGGASTEIVDIHGSVSLDLGSVRLTDQHLPDRPVPAEGLKRAERQCRGALATVEARAARLIGVAGTWTSLAAMELSLEEYDPREVHHSRLTRDQVENWVERLAQLSVPETAHLPGLDPARAPVILGGSMVAGAVMEHLGCDDVLISERDLLDGLAAGLL